MMWPEDLLEDAEQLLDKARAMNAMIATAESCTGGLISALLTEIAGSSDVFDRGFVTYSNLAKIAQLGVSAKLLNRCGAVSEEVAIAMASGAIAQSHARISVAVTGIAGPGGGSDAKPVGLVYIACSFRSQVIVKRHRFDGGRAMVRLSAVRAAIELLHARLV